MEGKGRGKGKANAKKKKKKKMKKKNKRKRRKKRRRRRRKKKKEKKEMKLGKTDVYQFLTTKSFFFSFSFLKNRSHSQFSQSSQQLTMNRFQKI